MHGLSELLILGLLGLGLLSWLAMLAIAASKRSWGWLGLLLVLPCLAGGGVAAATLTFRQRATTRANAALRESEVLRRTAAEQERALHAAEQARTMKPSQPGAKDPVAKDPEAWLREHVSNAGLTLVSLEMWGEAAGPGMDLTVRGAESKFRRWVEKLEDHPKLEVHEMIMVASEPTNDPQETASENLEVDQEIRGTVSIEVLSD